MEARKTMSSFLLCLKISSERLQREKEELLPLLEEESKKRRSVKVELHPVVEEISKKAQSEEVESPPHLEEERRKKKMKKKEKKLKQETKEIQVVQILPSPFVDLNEEPSPLLDELNARKPTFVFNRRLTDSDVRRDLARCILNRREMEQVLVPALTEEESDQVYDLETKLRVVVVDDRCNRYEMKLVWWPSLKQFALVNGWTEFVNLNGLEKHDTIQVSFFRFGDEQPLQLGLLIDCRPQLKVPQQEEDTINGGLACS